MWAIVRTQRGDERRFDSRGRIHVRDHTLQSVRARLLWSVLVLPCIAGCSLQDFDYLKNQGGSAGSAGSGGTSGDVGGGGAGGTGGASEDGAVGQDAAADTDDGGPSADTGASSEGGDASTVSILVNGSFELGYSGWSFEPPTAQSKYAYTQVPQGSAYTPDGSLNELATWSGTDAFTVRVFQIFSGLPSGKYTFSGYFNRGDGLNNAYVYANNCGGPERTMPIPRTADTQWLQIGIGGIDVTAGQCEVGFLVDSNPNNWLNADAFSFALEPQ